MRANYIKPYRFKIFTFLLLLIFFTLPILGQVTVGDGVAPQDYSILEVVSNGTGGLRLPQLSSKQRNDLEMSKITDAEKKAKAIGLTIVNTDNGCYEYWNGSEWISLCEGQSDIGFIDNNGNDVDPTRPAFPCKGESRGPFTPKEEKQCTGISIPYTYTLVSGAGMLNLQVTDPATGKFTVTASENPTARMRTAIVRVTNNCTGKHRDLLFTQEGCDDLCRFDITKPLINVSNNGDLCQNGAVYMYVTNPSNDVNVSYIWTLNDVEMGRGIWYVATTPGEYVVYVNAIGCDTNASDRIKVTYSDTDAPSGNMVIQASNNGIICNGSTIKMMAYNLPASGTLTWYKNGIKTAKTGNPITLASTDIGTWFAVMEDGSCTSRPSNSINVIYNDQSTSLTTPQININETPLASISSLCKGGRLDLELANYNDYYTTHQVAVTVSWYNATTLLGEGPTLSVVAPSSGDFILRCVVSDNTGFFCSSEVIEIISLSGNAPNVPGISGVPYICGGVPTSLTAMISGSGSYIYEWYKDDQLLAEQGQTLLVKEIGTYRVAAKDGSCISDRSLPVTVSLSDFPVLRWSVGSDVVEPGQVHTYLVEGFYNPTKYTWTVDNGATIENGQGTQAATIRFPNTQTTVNIEVVAENHCGTGKLLTKEVTVKDACTAPNIAQVKINPASETILSGTTLNMEVRLNEGTPPFKYEWKRDNVVIHSEVSEYMINTYNIPNVQKTHEGTYSVEVSNSCGTAGPVVAGKKTVINVNLDFEDPNGRLSGIDCFDVVQVNNDNDCGRLNIRKPYQADFTKPYVYTFTSMAPGNSNLIFFIDDPEEAVESYTVQPNIPTILADGGKYTVTVKYKESLMQSAAGRSNDNPISVIIYALYTNGGKEKGTRRIVTIKDCDCCSTVMDLEENEYTAHRFGDAGCWMTQNLRSTYNETMWVGAIQKKGNVAGIDLTTKAWYYPMKNETILNDNPEAGLLYTYLAATYGVISETIESGDAGRVKSKVQGLCPEGWVLPSDFDWSELEKAIASDPSKYAAMPSGNIWDESARYIDGARGSWGKAFISPKNLFASSSTGGVSNTDHSGFNGFLVGYMNSGVVFNAGTGTQWWSTSASSDTFDSAAWTRQYGVSDNGSLARVGKVFRSWMLSVRCKKWEE